MDKEKYIEVAISAAKEAGKVHKKYFNRNVQAKEKTASFDLVTVADLEAEKAIVSVVRKYFPGHNFLAEENKYEETGSEYTWVIDPLDGTNNFACGLPIFCVSIAIARNKEVCAGVIYDPTRDELFYARKHHGAFLNGKRIRVSSAKKLTESLLTTGFYYDRGKDMIENLEKIKQFFLKDIVGIRRLGAAALDLSYVACGRISGFWEFTLSPWDFAAGKLLVEEAGGKVTGRYGQAVSLEKCFIVASNGKIHDTMLEILKD
jgi:myo-inositol-1(or 4)-monophosphatase